MFAAFRSQLRLPALPSKAYSPHPPKVDTANYEVPSPLQITNNRGFIHAPKPVYLPDLESPPVDRRACKTVGTHTDDEDDYGSPSQGLHFSRTHAPSHCTHDDLMSSYGSPYSQQYPNRADGAASHLTHDSGESYNNKPRKFLKTYHTDPSFSLSPPSPAPFILSSPGLKL